MKITTLRSALMLTLFVSIIIMSCATVGFEFASDNVTKIKIGESTQQDILDLFGDPWRTGIEDGNVTWTYGHYHYCMFGGASTSDLVVRFDDKGVVYSYSYNTTGEDDK